jgi:DNA polymerase I-like protein with 3'-5' exonuclease and polymerase domains
VCECSGTVYSIIFSEISAQDRDTICIAFTNPDRLLIGHDLKQLVKALRVCGIEAKNKLFDLMIASYVINSSTRAHDLPEPFGPTIETTGLSNSKDVFCAKDLKPFMINVLSRIIFFNQANFFLLMQ